MGYGNCGTLGDGEGPLYLIAFILCNIFLMRGGDNLMQEKLSLIKGEERKESDVPKKAANEEMLMHFKAVMSSMTQDAQVVWTEILEELEGAVGPGVAISSKAKEEGFVPTCGWGEFMEKFWLLKHYLDHANRLCKE